MSPEKAEAIYLRSPLIEQVFVDGDSTKVCVFLCTHTLCVCVCVRTYVHTYIHNVSICKCMLF